MSNFSISAIMPNKVQEVTLSDTNITMGGGSFCIAWANSDATVSAVSSKGDAISISILAGQCCPIMLREIVSTTANIIIGY